VRLRAQLRIWLRSHRAGREQRARVQRYRAYRPGVRSLVFANAYARAESVPQLAPFVGNVHRLAGDRLRIVFVNGWTSRGDRDEERTVLEDVASGAADLAWVGARAVGVVLGVHSLEPLHAPLLFPGGQAVRRVLLSGLVAPLLEPLQEVGLSGLALFPGGLRRPFGITAPLIGVEDWRGRVIRTHASLTGEATLRALHATPVLRSTAELGAGPPPGVDGMDLHAEALAAWRYPGWLTTNVCLWPRLVLLVGNRRRLERLALNGRLVLEEAARQTLVETAKKPAPPHERNLPDTVQLVKANRDDLANLRDRLQSVHDELCSTREGETTLRQIEQMIATGRSGTPHPGLNAVFPSNRGD
jgi:TRAP-type transport system periplasmic protein